MNPQHPAVDQISLSNVLAALGDPTRLAIVAELARKGDGPVSCSHFLMFTSRTNLSYHLAKLREAGVTRTEVSGTSRFTTLRRADLDQRFPDLLASVIAGASTEDESEAQTA
jgi:DNA-binding transcriptional ArsR family regulator